METNKELKDQYMKEALEMFASKYLIVPIFTTNINVAFNNRVQNVKAMPSQSYYVYDFSIEQ